MRMLLAAGLVLALLSGCFGSSDDTTSGTPDAQHAHDAVPAVDAGALLSELQDFATQFGDRSANSAEHEGARQWIQDKFASYGLETYRQDFENGIPQANILGIKWGTVRDHWVVVGGHYDTYNKDCSPGGVAIPDCPYRGVLSQGIYDDGSGTLMTLHLAKSFADVNTTYTYVFAAFDGEERGLQGSQAFVEHFAFGNSTFGDVTVHAMLDLDMFGLNWPGVDAPIYFDSNAPQLDEEVARLVADLDMPGDQIKYQGISLGRSDYAHFFNLGVPTGFFISSFEEYQAPLDIPADGQNPAANAYPFWHRADTWDTMVLMAGSEADVEAGFQTAVDLALGVLCFMGEPANTYDVEIE